MKKASASNIFTDGLVMDFNPIATPNNVVVNALNATMITANGNENVLQNDMGNGRVETAYLPEGYVPLGTCSLGGIIYVVSYNPLTDKCQIGSFPSPERNITQDEIATTKTEVTNDQFQNSDGTIKNVILKVKLLSNSEAEDGLYKLNPGDKYTIYSINGGISANESTISDVKTGNHKVDATPRYVTIHVVSIGDDGKITYLDDTLKWYSPLDYYIKECNGESNIQKDIDDYRSLVSTAYNVFNSKISGELALLFELKTIDSFTVTWDADVVDNTGADKETYDKVATVTFNLNWTSSHTTINLNYAEITDSSYNDPTDPYKGYSCELPDYSGRLNDGSDSGEEVKVGEFKYKSSDDLSNYIWEYTVTPAMKFGKLSYLAQSGTINFAEIGSGKIELDEWRYYVQENSFYLNWGLDAYPEINKKIEEVTFSFIPFEKVSDSTVYRADSSDLKQVSSFPQYTVSGKSSYAGNFQEVINFGETSKVVNGEINPNYLYLVDIAAKYGSDKNWIYRHTYRWLYTTDQWNDKFLEGQIEDFSTLTLTDTIDFSSSFDITDNIVHTQKETTLALPETVPSKSDEMAYADLGVKLFSVNYNYDSNQFLKTNSDVTVDIGVTPSKYDELFEFKLQGADKFTNSISNKYITTSDLTIDSDSTSAISEYVKSKIMTTEEGKTNFNESTLISAISSIVSDNLIKDTTVDDKAVDSFETIIQSGTNSNKLVLSVYGALFSRINADLVSSEVTVGQRVRPVLYNTDDYSSLGLINEKQLDQWFATGQEDGGSGKPFEMKVGRFSTSTSKEEESYQSSKDDWDPSDNPSFDYYWEGVYPYTNYLNGWMVNAQCPFAVVRYSHYHSGHPTKANGTNVTGRYGVWVRTDQEHFVPLLTTTSTKDEMFKKIIQLLLQIYYVESDAASITRTIVKYINRLATYTETWNIAIASTLAVSEMANSLQLKPLEGAYVPLKTLQDRCNSYKDGNDKQIISVENITHEGKTLNLGSSLIAHSFKMNTDDLYVEYENAKTTSIPSLWDISILEKSVTGQAKNASNLYAYKKDSGLVSLSNKENTKYIYQGGTINLVSQDDGTSRLYLKDTSGNYKANELLTYLKWSNGQLVADEDKLLRSYCSYQYDSGNEGGMWVNKSNSKLTFMTT